MPIQEYILAKTLKIILEFVIKMLSIMLNRNILIVCLAFSFLSCNLQNRENNKIKIKEPITFSNNLNLISIKKQIDQLEDSLRLIDGYIEHEKDIIRNNKDSNAIDNYIEEYDRKTTLYYKQKDSIKNVIKQLSIKRDSLNYVNNSINSSLSH